MASNVLPLFWQLSSTEKEARLEASQQLVTALETFQSQHVAGQSSKVPQQDELMESDEDEEEDEDEDDDESGVEVDEDDDGGMPNDTRTTKEMDEDEAEIAKLDRAFEAANSEDVRYSIKRLIRGLASSRENSRFGFAVALTEVGHSVPRFRLICTDEAFTGAALCSDRHHFTKAHDFLDPSWVSNSKFNEGSRGTR